MRSCYGVAGVVVVAGDDGVVVGGCVTRSVCVGYYTGVVIFGIVVANVGVLMSLLLSLLLLVVVVLQLVLLVLLAVVLLLLALPAVVLIVSLLTVELLVLLSMV